MTNLKSLLLGSAAAIALAATSASAQTTVQPTTEPVGTAIGQAGQEIVQGAEQVGEAGSNVLAEGAAETQMAAGRWDQTYGEAYGDFGDRNVEELMGTSVISAEGNNIGNIDNFVLVGDQIAAVVGIGGFLGLGQHNVALALSELTWDGERLVVQAYTEEQLRELPAYDEAGGGQVIGAGTFRSGYDSASGGMIGGAQPAQVAGGAQVQPAQGTVAGGTQVQPVEGQAADTATAEIEREAEEVQGTDTTVAAGTGAAVGAAAGTVGAGATNLTQQAQQQNAGAGTTTETTPMQPAAGATDTAAGGTQPQPGTNLTEQAGGSGTVPVGSTEGAAATDTAATTTMEQPVAGATDTATDTATDATVAPAEGATDTAATETAVPPAEGATDTAADTTTVAPAEGATDTAATETAVPATEGATVTTAETTEQPAAGATVQPGAGAVASADRWTDDMNSVFGDIADREVAELIGTDVAGADGDVVGQVDNFALQGDQVVAVVGVGGFLGLGKHSVGLPLDQLTWDGERLVMSGMTEEDLRAMPAYDEAGGAFLEGQNTLRGAYNEM